MVHKGGRQPDTLLFVLFFTGTPLLRNKVVVLVVPSKLSQRFSCAKVNGFQAKALQASEITFNARLR